MSEITEIGKRVGRKTPPNAYKVRERPVEWAKRSLEVIGECLDYICCYMV